MSDWASQGVYSAAEIRRRPFPIRFLRSYRLWRTFLPVWTSLLNAWVVARS
ncbi:hypothetical protein [Microvirga sp. G4-2]|uniref:hypothetical protein n=1 Tax=Microvirga sp. G4-2 TaxID=3434467 RepID=UPI004043A2D8